MRSEVGSTQLDRMVARAPRGVGAGVARQLWEMEWVASPLLCSQSDDND